MSGDCLSKGVGGARPSKTTTEKRKIIERLKPEHALNDLLHVAKMPRSSFYYKEIKRNKPTECPIIHSDQGVLYGTAEWVKMLEGKAVQSMNRRGNCYDNAVIESFFAILKSECFYSRSYHSIAELQAEIEEYLVYYNQKRIKLAFKGLSPVQYRAQYLS